MYGLNPLVAVSVLATFSPGVLGRGAMSSLEDLPVEPLNQRMEVQPGLERGLPSSGLVLRRQKTKKRPPQAFITLPQRSDFIDAAVAAETGEGHLLPLAITAKRKHVHWTHVRVFKEGFVQPRDMTREQFWKHLEECYRRAYPDPRSPTGSIVAFGLVAEEQHAQAATQAQRDLHKHAAMFTTTQHYWSKVARISREQFQVSLNAVAHDTYTDMYTYLRQPSIKKPLPELDATPYFSPLHPVGDELSELLRASSRSGKANRGKCANRDKTAPVAKRARLPSLYEVCSSKGLRTVEDVQAHACAEAAEGRVALAEFCTRNGHRMSEIVSSAWQVVQAPAKVADMRLTLLDKLHRAATTLPCRCGGRWAGGAAQILMANQIPVYQFCEAVCRALQYGAARGVNIACVGEGGCGKSTLLEPLEDIFVCLEKPQAGSTFPLSNLERCDIILWQDYLHDESTMRFTDLLSLLVGESIGLRFPGRVNAKHRNCCPTFYSGRAPMRWTSRDDAAAVQYNGMMDERFTIFHFRHPLPIASRRADWSKCGRCAAGFYLSARTGLQSGPATLTNPVTRSACSAAPAVPLYVAPTSMPGAMMASLRALVVLHSQGCLSDMEFSAFKAKLLASSQ